MKNLTRLHVSILGAGDMARGLGTRFVAGENSITLFARNKQNAQALQEELQQKATAGVTIQSKLLSEPITDDVIILAIPYTAVPQIVGEYNDQLSGKILVDVTNPVDLENLVLLTPPGLSAAEELSKIAPKTARIVKSFNTAFWRTLVKGSVGGNPIDVFMAGDDNSAKAVVANLARSGGMRPLDAGSLESARVLEGIQLIHMKLQKEIGTGRMSSIQIVA